MYELYFALLNQILQETRCYLSLFWIYITVRGINLSLFSLSIVAVLVVFVCFLFVVFYEEYKNMTYQSVLAMWRWRKEGQGVLMREFKFLTQNWNILIFRSQTAYCLGHKNDSEEIFVMSQDVDSRGLKPSTPNSADLSLMSSLTKSNEVMLW